MDKYIVNKRIVGVMDVTKSSEDYCFCKINDQFISEFIQAFVKEIDEGVRPVRFSLVIEDLQSEGPAE